MSNITRRIQSPCIRNCCLSNEDVCLGCFRLITEITGWSEADDVERLEILVKAEHRKTAYYTDMKKRLG